MLVQIIGLLLGTAADLLTLAFLARAWLQWARAPFRNALGRFIAAVTDWAVLRLRRLIPGLFGIDLASACAAWLTQIVFFGIMAGLTGLVTAVAPGALLDVLWIAALAVLRMTVYLLMGVVIIAAVLSWISPHAPLMALFDTLARPLLGPIRRRLPLMGGIDLSPLVVLLLLQVALIVLANLRPLPFILS
jgi:YggT family protein